MSIQAYINQIRSLTRHFFLTNDDVLSRRYKDIKANEKDFEKYNEAVEKLLRSGGELKSEDIILESGEKLTLVI